MSPILYAINVAAGFVIVAEALSRLERLDVFDVHGRPWFVRLRLVVVSLVTPWRWTVQTRFRFAHFVAWFACALGGGGAVMSPFAARSVSASEVFALVGFATLIVQRCIADEAQRRKGVAS